MLMRPFVLFILVSCLLTSGVCGAEKYTGPKPPKTDVPYLLQANKLIETETADASNQQSKAGDVYMVSGAASPAKTPLAEPIFLLDSDKLNPNSLELYRMDVKGGNREVVVPKGGRFKRGSGPKQFRLNVTKVADHLYRIEASETLENGQYSLSPTDSNKAFCFEVY
jgi:hypothetical protein